MEERTRLGRGLEDVSHLYLSDHPRDAYERTRKTDAHARRRHIIRIFYPGSIPIKSCFLANFALELARSRFHVDIWDGDKSDGAGVETMIQGIVHQGLSPGAGTVKLYGIPDILVYNAEVQPHGKLIDLAGGSCMERDRFLLVSIPDSLESIIGWDTAFDAILLTPVDGASLLRCYAYCKVIWGRDPLSRIHIGFDNPDTPARAHEIFSRFAVFAKERLSGNPNFLGCLIHDDLLDRSITERKPLVLRYDSSAAKDSLLAMSASFIQSRQAHTPTAGTV